MKAKLIKNISVYLAVIVAIVLFATNYSSNMARHYDIFFVMFFLFVGAFACIWTLRRNGAYRLTTSLPLFIALLSALFYLFTSATGANMENKFLDISSVTFYYITLVLSGVLLIGSTVLDFVKFPTKKAENSSLEEKRP